QPLFPSVIPVTSLNSPLIPTKFCDGIDNSTNNTIFKMEFRNDFKQDFDEDFSESFSVGTQNVPSLSDSIGPNEPPYTPISGPSTPAYFIPLEAHNTECGTPSACFGLTPPGSSFGGYFPEPKQDPAHYTGFDQFLESPSRRDNDPADAIPQQLMDSYPPLETMPPVGLPPMGLPPMVWNFDNPTYEAPAWGWPLDGPIHLFTGPDLPRKEQPLQDGYISPIPPVPTPSAHQTMHLRVDEVRQKTTALHKAQQRRIAKRRKIARVSPDEDVWIGRREEAGKHKCDHPDCVGKSGFKRSEHLKRHKETVHYIVKLFVCPFCTNHRVRMNRPDNFRSHILLHMRKDGNGRVPHHPGAEDYYNRLMAAVKPRNRRNRNHKVRRVPQNRVPAAIEVF
ncbi:hypothetical protein F4803DRAFT_569511, partial [Xylaria telfairii]